MVSPIRKAIVAAAAAVAVVATQDRAIKPRLLRPQAERSGADSGTRPETLRGLGPVLNKEPQS
jgi:hypothetical protein